MPARPPGGVLGPRGAQGRAGGSQGAGQAVLAAGLDPRVSVILANEPALCDHTGHVAGRVLGWPQFFENVPLEKRTDAALHTVRLYDGVNFATHAKAQAIFTVGFIDNSVKPTTVYATFNAWAGPKQIIAVPDMAHEARPAITDIIAKAIRAPIAAAAARP